LAKRCRGGESVEPARDDLEVADGAGTPKVKLILASADVACAAALAAAGVCLAFNAREN
jgi:hypothetical protein